MVKGYLFLDIETFSNADIKKTGVAKYTEDAEFEIILIAYGINGGEIKIIDLKGDKTDGDLEEFLQLYKDPEIVKVAHNCIFERTCFSRHFGIYSPVEEWTDTMHLAAYNSLPLGLDGAGEILNLKEKKLKEGTALINYFCKPCKPTKSNGGRNRNRPEHDPEKWDKFVEYCKRDVVVCKNIYLKLRNYPVTGMEKKVVAVDTLMNETGVKVDLELAEKAVWIDRIIKEELMAELRRLTGLENPNSVTQLLGWFKEQGLEITDLSKKTVEELKGKTGSIKLDRALELRQLTGKSSVSKYTAMLNTACSDNRIRGLTQYYGATRSGRFAGRLVQIQNLPQNHLENIEEVRKEIKTKSIEELKEKYPNLADTLSQLLRTAFIAEENHTFLVADYSAIEARVIAWLAGEGWRIKAFADGEDIYCSSASKMFGVKVVKHGENGELRQKGKVAELACGYGGGVNALKAFGADKMGMTEEEMAKIVADWRTASPKVCKLWKRLEDAAKYAIVNKGKIASVRRMDLDGKDAGIVCKYWADASALRCELPSGRILTYWDARLEQGKIVYNGINTNVWTNIGTWGGKLTENVVQAVARDCLAVAMTRLYENGYTLMFTVHDEIIAEEPKNGRTWEEMAEIMSQPIDWADGLILPADGYMTDFYMKD